MKISLRCLSLLLMLGALAPGRILAAAAPPAASPAADVKVNGNGTVMLRLPDIGVFDAVLIYQKLTGKSAILPDSINAEQRMTIMAPEPVPTENAVQMLASALLLNGYALVPDEDGRVKVVSVKSDNPRGAGTPVYTGPASALPHDVPVITYFMPFTFLSAAEAEAVYRPQVALNAPYGAIVPVPSARALLITENVAVIRQLIAIKDLIDVARTDMRVEFVQLVSASANTVVDSINEILVGKNANPQDPTNLNLSLGTASPTDVSTRNVRLLADARTNRVIITAPSAAMPVLQALVERFDEAAQSGDPTEHKLKYVSAADVLPILRAALVEPGKTGEIDSSNISNLSGSNSSFSGSSYNSSSSNSSDMSGSKDVSARVAVKDDTDKATSVIVGKTRLIADNRTNTIVVIGPPASSKMVDQVLAVVDRPPKQVYLSTVIGQMSNTGSQELGIDILQKFTGNPNLGVGTISNPFKVTGPLNPQGVQVGTSAITQAAAGTNVYGLAGNTIAFYVQALQQTNRFRILSRPSVYTSNNKKAIISSGSEQPVPSSTQSNLVGNGNATNTSTVLNTNVQYKNVVLELAVVPLINANNEVTLNIAQRNDSLGDNVAVGSTTARAINTQELTTSITVANGQTVVLGGLLSDRDDLEKTGTPILSDIPILGALFSNTKKSTTKNELIILIQPIVIESPELAELQKDKQVQSEGLDQEAVKFLNQGNSMMKTPAEETHQFLRDVFNLPPPVPHR